MKANLLSLICLLASITLSSWGFYAHKIINRHAVFTLPSQLAIFYKSNVDQITERATLADKRCYIDSNESPRHYIDIDRYEEQPEDSIPIHWSQAAPRYQQQLLLARGVLPWQLFRTYQRLVLAFKSKDKNAIIRYSADLGHYLADAHVPLHTTSNYNGQYSQQVGIHALWESRLPEMFAERYNLLVGKACYIEDILAYGWQIVRESNALVDSVLLMEKNLQHSYDKHLQRAFVRRNSSWTASYSDGYAQAYHNALAGMVERRMQQSIQRLGSFWMSAWVAAGQPNIRAVLVEKDSLDNHTLELLNKKIMGRPEWH